MSYRENVQAIRSVPWGIPSALVVFLLPWVVLPILAFILVEVLAPSVPLLRQFSIQLANNDPGALFLFALVDVVGSIVTIGFFLNHHQVGLSTLGIRRFSVLRTLWYICLVLIGFLLLSAATFYIVQLLYPSFDVNQKQVTGYEHASLSISILALVVLPPLVEETVFRGYIFPAFSKRFGIVLGAIISSALFGLAHLQGNVSIYTFVLGLLLCWLYTRTGSIIPGMFIHMLNNYLAYTALK